MIAKISATIITFNEEKKIEECIQSLLDVVDEIIVVDSYSTDNTIAICKKYTKLIFKNKFKGHIEQKHFAVSQTKYDWILSLDADERLSDELKDLILKEKNHNFMAKAYFINRRTWYCSKWIYYCGWYPDKRIRLWNKAFGRWGGVNPHDKVILRESSKILYLNADILHYSFNTIADHIKTANHFSEIAAKEIFEKNKKVYLIKDIILNPIYTFFFKYFIKRGFLDGFYGFVICILSAISNFLKYTKAKNLYVQNKS